MMWSARSPSSARVYRTVTLTFARSLPSTRVSGVIRNVRVSELLPSTVLNTVILFSDSVVTTPEKNSLWGCSEVAAPCARTGIKATGESRRRSVPVRTRCTLTAYAKEMNRR